MIRSLVAALAAAAALGLGLAGARAATPLAPPFDLARAAPEQPGAASRPFDCPSPPHPVRDLDFGGFYKPGTGSTEVDPEAMRRYRAARKPIDAFEHGVSRMSDAYVASRETDARPALCAAGWMRRWAEAGAMLGDVSQQGGYVRKWSLATVAASWLKIRGAPEIAKDTRTAVRGWLARWADTVRTDYDTGTSRTSRRNNHVYWAAWAVALAAVALDDRELFNWSVAHYRSALGQIAADGTLPLEVARRSKALHYHVFATMPLVMLAELGAHNGLDLYGARGGALHRLVARVVSGLSDPAYFERLTGKKQEWVGRLNGGKLAWMEPYYARFPDPAMARWIARFRPMRNVRAGGDLTLLYGRALPPAH